MPNEPKTSLSQSTGEAMSYELCEIHMKSAGFHERPLAKYDKAFFQSV